MKRTIAVAVAGLLALALIGGSAAAAKPKKKKTPPQVVQGAVALSLIHPSGGCFPGVQRRIAVLGQGLVNGVAGFHFDVDKRTWGKKFELKVTGGTGPADMDILFYDTFGPVDDPLYDPTSVPYDTRAPGGEKGQVPAGMKKAIVCVNVPTTNASFTYTAQRK